MHWYPRSEPAELARAVTAGFRDRFGRAPDGVWAAPGRVNVIGEHVDYNAGLCLPFGLQHRTVVALATRDDGVLRLRSVQLRNGWNGRLDEIRPGSVRGWAGYAAGVPWALQAEGWVVPGFDALVDSQVPVGSGLSSSAALEAAVALALDEVVGLGLASSDAGRARLAAVCVRAENEVAGAPTGGLDQAAVLRTRSGHALLIDCRDFTVSPIPFDLAAEGLRLLVMDTRVHHALTDGRYGSRRQSCTHAARVLGVPSLREVRPDDLLPARERLAAVVTEAEHAGELYRRVRHVVSEIARVGDVLDLARAGRLRALGPMLDASHASLRDDFEVSCPELDLACRTAREAGALGARMVGGGFGGSAIALVPADVVLDVAVAVAAALPMAGFGDPAFLTAVPAGPGSRVDS